MIGEPWLDILVSVVSALVGGGMFVGLARLWEARNVSKKLDVEIAQASDAHVKIESEATSFAVGFYRDTIADLKGEIDKTTQQVVVLRNEVQTLRPLQDQVRRLQDGFDYLCEAVKDGYPVAVKIARERAGLR